MTTKKHWLNVGILIVHCRVWSNSTKENGF